MAEETVAIGDVGRIGQGAEFVTPRIELSSRQAVKKIEPTPACA